MKGKTFTWNSSVALLSPTCFFFFLPAKKKIVGLLDLSWKFVLVKIIRRGMCMSGGGFQFFLIEGKGLYGGKATPNVGQPYWYTFHMVPYPHIWISLFVYILDLCTFKVSPSGRFENCAGRTENVPKLLRDPFFRDPLCGTLWSGTLWSGTLWYVIQFAILCCWLTQI